MSCIAAPFPIPHRACRIPAGVITEPTGRLYGASTPLCGAPDRHLWTQRGHSQSHQSRPLQNGSERIGYIG
jgi:hypothetical protein